MAPNGHISFLHIEAHIYTTSELCPGIYANAQEKCSLIRNTSQDLPCDIWPMREHHTPNSELVSSASRFSVRLYYLELVFATV
jgi:hypothetical protein